MRVSRWCKVYGCLSWLIKMPWAQREKEEKRTMRSNKSECKTSETIESKAVTKSQLNEFWQQPLFWQSLVTAVTLLQHHLKHPSLGWWRDVIFAFYDQKLKTKSANRAHSVFLCCAAWNNIAGFHYKLITPLFFTLHISILIVLVILCSYKVKEDIWTKDV